ncbi:peptide ABC transporter permease [Vulcanibacillus modesticaldus]|uniref:Peptide ABC transporter permease n=1 Tax=Vulcanibacillus modesticaldus TaxID=337097 RepID=A0A1D2YVJ7_9BACI|nr:oligopeptide ABC transporter permease [Vulcanibacillus modesticaldus]OEF99744.1 peptide ABC transporter permease [Vulcanibacillus modesticaldus]
METQIDTRHSASKSLNKSKENTPWRIAFRKFKRNRMAVLGVWVLLIIVMIGIFAPYLTPHDPEYADLLNTNGKPDKVHWLGTDSSGRDIFARLLYGSRISLIIGFSAMLFTIVIGTILGSVAGYYGGKIDNIIMRLADIQLNFPFLLLVMTVVAILKEINILIFVSVMAFVSWPGITRIIRATFLSLREQEFILSARSIGGSDFRIIFRHMLPNAMGPIIVNATLFMAGMIISESALSFIGFGVPQPTPTWGNMLTEALSLRVLQYEPWAWIPPGIMIVITVLAINFIGDGLRDALDPRMRKS